MVRGEAFAEIRGEIRDLPIERPIISGFDITVGFLGPWAHTFGENGHDGLESVVATRFTLEVVSDLVRNGWWSEKREDSQ